MPDTTWSEWLDVLDLSHRHAPDFYLSGDSLTDAVHAGALRVAFDVGLDGVLCVNNAPTVGFIAMESFDPTIVQRLHGVLWNQGIMAMLIVVSGTDLRSFALTRREKPLDTDVGTNADPRLVEHLEMLSGAKHARNLLLKAESGQLFVDYPTQFKIEERIDNVLLGNLNASLMKLAKRGLPNKNAQALLMQSMLIAYLKDRKILSAGYFKAATENAANSLEDILSLGINDNVKPLKQLFEKLNRDLNGSVFIAPCGFNTADAPSVLPAHCEILRDLLNGDLNMHTGQLRFLKYDFRYIPVALISAVYNNFLDNEPRNRRQSGAYYTPLHLADLAVDQAWHELSETQRLHGCVLDPACGSGVFLVRMFERFVEHRRAKGLTLEWKDLVSVTERICGVDINETAIRLAASSIYIALLEQLDPPDIMALMAKGHMLPLLIETGPLKCVSFFKLKEDTKYDLIIGNPPWSSRRKDDTGALDWANRQKLEVPGNDLAWAFLWKSGEQLNDDGISALLLPAMGFLHNTNSVAARQDFFRKYKVLRIVTLSDLRFLLFDGATRPTTLALFSSDTAKEASYSFEYWTPKADIFAQRKRTVTLSHSDNIRLTSSQVQACPDILTQRFWLRSRGDKLLQYLNTFKPLNSFIDEHGNLGRRKAESRFGWIMGQGFTSANPNRLQDPTYKTEIEEEVTQHPFVSPKDLTPLALRFIDFEHHHSPIVHRKRFIRGFRGPHILLKQGPSNNRVRACYTEQNLAFIHSIQAIVFPPTEKDRAKALTAVLNSRLASWFYFITSSAWASERAVVRQNEYLTLPFPTIEEVADSKSMSKAQSQLVHLIDHEQNKHGGKTNLLTPTPPLTDSHLFSKLDTAVYDFYGLSESERIIVEDFFEHIIPASQPHLNTFPDLWNRCLKKERIQYASTLEKALSSWFPDASISISSPAQSKELVVLRLQLGNMDMPSKYHESDNDLSSILPKLWDALPENWGGNFQLIPNVRLFLDDSLYLVKPTTRRYWLRSSALEEADGIVADLHHKLILERQGGAE